MLTYSLIGCGRIATNHIKAALENKLDISALCDIIPEHMETLLQKHGLQENCTARRYTSHEQMLCELKPQIVAIATESGKHASIALDCIDAGCNVIIEKPISLALSETDEIIKRAEKKGVLVSTNHQNRFNHAVQHVNRALEQGRFGRLSHGTVNVRWNRNRDYYAQALWRGTFAQDGGALMNQSIHGIDLLRWMMGGKIDEVFAYTARRFHDYIECEDIGVALVKFSNGAIGTIEGTTNVFPCNFEETLHLFGENGTVKIGGESANTVEVWNFADQRLGDDVLSKGIVEETVNIYGNGHISVYADMIEAIRTGRRPYIDGEAGRDALELVLAIYKSAVEGRPVKLPMKDYGMEQLGRALKWK